MMASILGGGHLRAWGNLRASLERGVIAFDDLHGEDVWSYFTKTNPDEGNVFYQAMSDFSHAVIPAILSSYQFPATGTLVDVAGGNGTLLCAALSQQPGLRGIVTDLAFTSPAAEAYIATLGLSDRSPAVAADFISSVGRGRRLHDEVHSPRSARPRRRSYSRYDSSRRQTVQPTSHLRTGGAGGSPPHPRTQLGHQHDGDVRRQGTHRPRMERAPQRPWLHTRIDHPYALANVRYPSRG